MDDRIKAVLASYHERIARERTSPPSRTVSETEDWRDNALLAVGPETGQLINLLVKSLPSPQVLEIGTSFGYSGIWLAEAARASGGRLITLEQKEHKSAYAREMSAKAGLDEFVDFQVGDALELIGNLSGGVDFVLLDLWKDLYEPCLELFYPRLNPGAIIVADNMLRPGGEGVQRYQKAVRAKPGISSILLPVGTGIEVSRFEP